MNDVDINLVWGGERLMVDLASPIDISLSLKDSRQQKTPSAWYVDGIKFDAVKGESFIGRVAEGGSVNFTDVYFNPHGHGTHTECLGHIRQSSSQWMLRLGHIHCLLLCLVG